MNKRRFGLSEKTLSIFCIATLLFISCGTNHSPKCNELAKHHKAEKKYAESHTPNVGKVSVYVENTGSMDGYVNGNTEFKTDLFNILKLLGSKMAVEKNFINDSIIPVKLTDSQFSNGMSVSLFQEKGGNRGSSNIAELIEQVIDKNSQGEVSVFISDCVFDPQSDPDIQKRLAQQKTTIETAIKRKLSKNSEFGVMAYRLMSTFSGIYYNKVKPHTSLTGVQRPYFMWFFGDAFRLKKVRELLATDVENKARSKYSSQIFVQTNKIEYLPYTCSAAKCSATYGKHIEEPKEKDGKFSFVVRMDFRTLPLSADYLMDAKNYTLPHNNNYEVTSVSKCTKGKGKYTHELKITKTKGNIKDNTIVDIELKRPEVPNWATDYSDPLGDDFIKGQRKDRTFGLKSYLDGVYDAFDGNIATFTILIK